MSNPFIQQQSFEEFLQDRENERQDQFEQRIVEAIFKHAGCPPHVVKVVKKRLNRGTDQNCMDIRWFNHYCNFPLFVGTRRFDRRRTYEDLVKEQRSSVTVARKSVELAALVDLDESSPDRPVVLITRYAGSTLDWALHRQDHIRIRGHGWHGGSDFIDTEPLSAFVTYVAEQYGWNPADHLPVGLKETDL